MKRTLAAERREMGILVMSLGAMIRHRKAFYASCSPPHAPIPLLRVYISRLRLVRKMMRLDFPFHRAFESHPIHAAEHG